MHNIYRRDGAHTIKIMHALFLTRWGDPGETHLGQRQNVIQPTKLTWLVAWSMNFIFSHIGNSNPN